MAVTLYQLYQKMYQQMGPQHWWPADSKNEIVVGAILVQNTNWQNVDYSLANLRELTDFEGSRLAELDQETVIEAIRPSGFYRNKSRSILEVFGWLAQYDFDYEAIDRRFGDNLRDELLKLRGIGQETADALLLYVFQQKVFIADTYSQRLFKKLGAEGIKIYQSLHRMVSLEDFELTEAQEFHGLIVNFGKDYLKGAGNFEESFLTGVTIIQKEGKLL